MSSPTLPRGVKSVHIIAFFGFICLGFFWLTKQLWPLTFQLAAKAVTLEQFSFEFCFSSFIGKTKSKIIQMLNWSWTTLPVSKIIIIQKGFRVKTEHCDKRKKRYKTLAKESIERWGIKAWLFKEMRGKQGDNCGLWLKYQQKQMADVETTPTSSLLLWLKFALVERITEHLPRHCSLVFKISRELNCFLNTC